jgi:hypothetical protein
VLAQAGSSNRPGAAWFPDLMDLASGMLVMLVVWLTGSVTTAAAAAAVERRVRLGEDHGPARR